MNQPLVVLITKGKVGSVESVQVNLYSSMEDAYRCVECNCRKEGEHWWYAEIISEGSPVELNCGGL